nr:HAMP domain-containing sensor histidine kinase [Nanchangia anserum]
MSTRLTTITVGLLTAGLMLAGTTVIGILQSHLIGQVDAQLAASAKQVALTAANSPVGQSASTIPTSYYVRVHLSGERVSEWLPSNVDDLGRPAPADIERLDQATGLQTSLPTTVRSTMHGEAWRAQAVPMFTSSGSSADKVGTVIVALPLTNIQETLNNTAIYLFIASFILVATGGFAAHYLVGLSLRELRAIESVAGRIVEGDMSERVTPREPATTEVGSLTRSLNRMLGRIERAFLERQRSEEKMRQFVSDASHELRTPLAAVRGYGELYRLGGVPPERITEVMARIESEATRMGGMVEDLLRLARLDEGRRISFASVDIVTIVREAAMDLTALDPGRDVSLIGLDGGDACEELHAIADRNLLSQVVTNLVGNVDRYTPTGSPVELAIGTVALADIETERATWPRSPYLVGTHDAEDAVVIEVRDHGPGIPEADRLRVFERFYRIDDSRSRDTGGTGLGLSIVKTVADVHGGGVRALETEGGGLTMRLAFPRCLDAPAPDSGTDRPDAKRQARGSAKRGAKDGAKRLGKVARKATRSGAVPDEQGR